MGTAFLRKLAADIRSNTLQFLLIGGVLFLSAALLTISLLVLDSSSDPWDQAFEQTHGPHLWVVSHQHDLDFSPLSGDPAVSETTDLILALSDNPLVLGEDKIKVFLYALDQRSEVARPFLVEGSWLDPGRSGQIVLDYSLARYHGFQLGDTVMVLGATGNHSFQVVGLAVTTHWFPYDDITKDTTPGMAYISQASLEALQPDPAHWYAVMGVRLKNPDASQELTNRVYDLFPGQLQTVIDWKYVKDTAALASTLNAMFMGLFSVIGLAAVGMIIFNTISGQTLSQYREIGLLKAVGFKPRQVTLLFLAENLAVASLAAVLGILAGLLMSPGLVNTMAENLNTPPPDIYQPVPLIGVFLLIQAAVAAATWLPARSAARIDTVQAITLGYRKRSRGASWLAAIAAWLRAPAVVILGLKDTFTRPLRSIMAIASLLLTIVILITAVGARTTVDHLAQNRFYFNGTSADLKVERNFIPYALIADQILQDPLVEDSYQELFVYGQIPGHSEQPLAVRLLAGSYQDFDFQIKEGRMISAPGEAVLGYAVLDLMDAHLGDTIDILVEGATIPVTIVGRHTENFNLNNVIITSLETYQEYGDPQVQPTIFYPRLSDSSQADQLREDWLEKFGGLVSVSVIREEPVYSVTQLRDLIASMAVILLLVAFANLMSASLLSVRERVRDFGIQKTLGLTPAQIAGSVVVGSIALTLIALLIGVTLGMAGTIRFIQQVGIAIGAGPDFYTINWGGISLLLPVLVLLAALSSLLPAIRAARLEITQALRYE